jgi:hypothetical protein
MRFIAAVLTMLGLAACSSTPNDPGQGLADSTVMRQQQVVQDVHAILRGMNEARTQAELEHQQAE